MKWLEDFLSLADSRSFSRSAEERHVTQPAFSRRIKALEDWLGTELVDRSTYPTTLTPAGRTFVDDARVALQQLYEARAALGKPQLSGSRGIRFAVAHTLSHVFFPRWLSELQSELGPIAAHVRGTNILEGASALVQGDCDVLLCYHNAQVPVLLDTKRFEFLNLGIEQVLPVSAPSADGTPLYALPGLASAPVSLLAYKPISFLGRIVDNLLQNPPAPHHLHRCYESDRPEAVKAMALEKHGLGWLPERLVREELASGVLVAAADPVWNAQISMRMYQARENANPVLARLWQHLNKHSRAA